MDARPGVQAGARPVRGSDGRGRARGHGGLVEQRHGGRPERRRPPGSRAGQPRAQFLLAGLRDGARPDVPARLRSQRYTGADHHLLQTRGELPAGRSGRAGPPDRAAGQPLFLLCRVRRQPCRGHLCRVGLERGQAARSPSVRERRGAEQRQAADSAPTSPPAARPDLEAVEGSIYVPMDRPRLTFWQMYNMSFGFLGIQFGWGLQLAIMSAVYERLGARPDQVPLLWLAAPPTRLLGQPILGPLSDRPWGRLGPPPPHFLPRPLPPSIPLFPIPRA